MTFLSNVRDENGTMVEMLTKSLTVVSRLLTSRGDGATRLRLELVSNKDAVSNLMSILETDSKGAQKLHEQALEILIDLAFDDSFKKLDFNKLVKALLGIFLEKEDNKTTVQEPKNATSQVEQAERERATRLRGKAGEALARLLPIHAARGILSEQEAINLPTMVTCNLSLCIAFYLTFNFSYDSSSTLTSVVFPHAYSLKAYSVSGSTLGFLLIQILLHLSKLVCNLHIVLFHR